jgi:hypothetical protein
MFEESPARRRVRGHFFPQSFANRKWLTGIAEPPRNMAVSLRSTDCAGVRPERSSGTITSSAAETAGKIRGETETASGRDALSPDFGDSVSLDRRLLINDGEADCNSMRDFL